MMEWSSTRAFPPGKMRFQLVYGQEALLDWKVSLFQMIDEVPAIAGSPELGAEAGEVLSEAFFLEWTFLLEISYI